MTLSVAIQMDPIERIRIAGDTGFALMLEAQARGHRLFTYTPDKLSMRDGKVTAPVKGATLIGNGPETMQRVQMIGQGYHDTITPAAVGAARGRAANAQA